MTKQQYINIAVQYFPDALAEIGKLSVLANEKHNPGEPIHWSKDKANDHIGSLDRHRAKIGKIDEEFGLLHDVHMAWRGLANLQVIKDKE